MVIYCACPVSVLKLPVRLAQQTRPSRYFDTVSLAYASANSACSFR